MHENRNNLRGSQEEVVGKTGTAYIKKYDDRTSAFCAMCGAWRGELGLEPTFHLYIKHLCDIFDEVKRVLKKTGSCWVVMGDTYWSAKGSCWNPGGGANSIETPKKNKGAYPLHRGNRSDIPYLKPKSLCLIPSRFAIEMCNRGWVLRNVIIWHKRNCMPCSARDRFTVDFESVYFFVKSRRYFFEQQFEPMAAGSAGRYNYGFGGDKNELIYNTVNRTYFIGEREPPLSRRKRCVWDIRSQPFFSAHFAVFPDALVEIPIKAGCPEHVCRKCGKPREKIFKTIKHKPIEVYAGQATKDYARAWAQDPADTKRRVLESMRTERRPLGHSDCGCGKGFSPGVVLDPFVGSGTTAAVARKLGRDFIGIDINLRYVKMAKQRLASLRSDSSSA